MFFFSCSCKPSSDGWVSFLIVRSDNKILSLALTCNFSWLITSTLICPSYCFYNTFVALSYCLQQFPRLMFFFIKSTFYIVLTLVFWYKHKTILPNVVRVKLRNNQILLRSHWSELCKRIHKSILIIHFANFIVFYYLNC